jgi:HSP20 family protein
MRFSPEPLALPGFHKRRSMMDKATDVPVNKSRSLSPFRDLASQVSEPMGWLRSEIDRLFDDFGRPRQSIFNFGNRGSIPVPALEMIEDDKAYKLTAELPGLKEDDVEISVGDGVLTISGEKKEESERKDKGFMLSERRYGSFHRQVALPADVDPNGIKARFDKGVLTLTLAKDENVAPRKQKIAIEKP